MDIKRVRRLRRQSYLPAVRRQRESTWLGTGVDPKRVRGRVGSVLGTSA